MLILFLFMKAGIAFGQPGSPDPSFDTDGVAYWSEGIGTYNEAWSIVAQPDGKILLSGFIEPTGVDGSEAVLLRLNADGSPDLSFGTGGRVLGNFGDYYDVFTSLSLQPDGKIVVGGYAINSSFIPSNVIMRYNPDGSPDLSFNSTGMLTLPATPSFCATYSALQPDGKIIAAVNTNSGFSNENIIMHRFNADGSVDNSFGTAGMAVTNLPLTHEFITNLTLQADGKIVVIAKSENIGTGNEDFFVARYLADGAPDPAFSGDGTFILDLNNNDYPSGVAVQADGKIVVTGTSGVSSLEMEILRLNPDGSLDTSFDLDGIAQTGIVLWDLGVGVTLQPDGKIVTIAISYNGTDADFLLARFNSDGSLDPSFDLDGIALQNFGGDEYGIDITLQPDGKILVAGYSGYQMAVARFFSGLTVESEDYTEFSPVLSLFPNPVVESATLTYSLVQSGSVVISIYDESGKLLMRSHASGHKEAGLCFEKVEGIEYLPSGTYNLVVSCGDELKSIKFIKVPR